MSSLPQVPQLTEAAFHAAIAAGDLEIIEAFFAQPHVRAEVIDTNAYIAESGATSLETATQRDGSLPWFRRCPDVNAYIVKLTVPIVVAARCGHTYVVDWFFARERAIIMPETLELLLSTVAQFLDEWSYQETPAILQFFEALVTSFAFQHAMSDVSRQQCLDDVAGSSTSDELLRLTIAHGAQVGSDSVLLGVICTDTGDDTKTVYTLAHEGGTFLGADVLALATERSRLFLAAALARLGADWGNATTKPLIAAAKDMWVLSRYEFDMLLECGFYDLDARGEHGETALMVAVQYELPAPECSCECIPSKDPAVLFAFALIENGADVDAVDNEGRTALDFARQVDGRYSPDNIYALLKAHIGAAHAIDQGAVDDAT